MIAMLDEYKTQLSEVCGYAHLKQKGLSYSRMEHHRSALKIFYAMLVKLDIVTTSPAQALPKLKKNGPSTVMPVSKDIVFKLLNSVDRSTWMENRNYLILSLLWALGLRVSELTRLVIGSFEPGHGPKIGLLRVKGKNKKQRALFVVDIPFKRLFFFLMRKCLHDIINNLDSLYCLASSFWVMLNINNDISKIIMSNNAAVSMIITPGA